MDISSLVNSAPPVPPPSTSTPTNTTPSSTPDQATLFQAIDSANLNRVQTVLREICASNPAAFKSACSSRVTGLMGERRERARRGSRGTRSACSAKRSTTRGITWMGIVCGILVSFAPVRCFALFCFWVFFLGAVLNCCGLAFPGSLFVSFRLLAPSRLICLRTLSFPVRSLSSGAEHTRKDPNTKRSSTDTM
jgi:hypothetical protein